MNSSINPSVTPRGKPSVAGVIIASFCIVIYFIALVYAAVSIYTSIDERGITAEREFLDLADLASSAGVLGFMDEAFVQTIEDAIAASRTIEGVIISGPNGEYAFERERGQAVNWVNNSPRFKSRFDFSRQPLHRPLRIAGLRNVNIQAKAGAVDYVFFTEILKQALVLVLGALALAFFTLLLEALIGEAGAKRRSAAAAANDERPAAPVPMEAESPAAEEFFQEEAEPSADAPDSPEEPDSPVEPDAIPRGLFSPRSNIGWKEYTTERLDSELRRSASAEQDLVFIGIEWKDGGETDFYRHFAADVVRFFIERDLIFEKGERGIAVICPGIDLETGFAKAEDFHRRMIHKYSRVFKTKTGLCIGLSSRSGRLVEAERLMFEAEEALERALADPVSHLVAFKSDPEKYRAFVRGGGARQAGV